MLSYIDILRICAHYFKVVSRGANTSVETVLSRKPPPSLSLVTRMLKVNEGARTSVEESEWALGPQPQDGE